MYFWPFQFEIGSPGSCSNFYMDDFVCSVDSFEQAVELQSQMVNLCKSGGFDLVKWSTNSKDLLEKIPVRDRLPCKVNFDSDLSESPSIKILGIQWHPESDNFSFSVNWSNRPCTKRLILSAVSSVFDPLGLIQPVILMCKLLISDLWKAGIDWDQKPPTSICDRWHYLQSEIGQLSQIQIPRYLGKSASTSSTILVGFADSSEQAYGAVIYCVCTNALGENQTHLLCSKSKVAPMKTVSIPRLELCAALLLSNLMCAVLNSYNTQVANEQVYCFSDSKVTLDWIHSSPHRWTQFVANRVAKIQQNIDTKHWFHVAGKENPADCASRGMFPDEIIDHDLWWKGPSWLLLPLDKWPLEYHSMNDVNSLVELKKNPETTCALTQVQSFELLDLSGKFSSWMKLLRSIVYVLRLVKVLPIKPVIELTDLDSAESRLVMEVQLKHFPELFKNITSGSHQLRKLDPFVSDGIIRVGGRLTNSNLEFEQRHPILLPKNDPIVTLIIQHYHRTNLHTGTHLLLTLIRQKYWIISARSQVKKHVNKCNHCFRISPKPSFPKMGDLPECRVNESKPFLHTGVDYCGPFSVTMISGRGIKSSKKAYVCLFICLTTKAVHIELASDLSTETFLNAFKRFISRRGSCRFMYSDCGTNFIGAKHALDELYNFLQSSHFEKSIQNELNLTRVVWKTNPPLAPHMGGIWESQMRPIKSHLMKVVGTQILTFEELSTVLIQIEALLNSRPLCKLSSDVSEVSALTPAHFLLAEPVRWLPAKDVSMSNVNRLSRYELLDQLVQSYWARWSREYLTTLQVRDKWTTNKGDLNVGDTVILIQDNLPVLQWPLGIVQDVFPGRDGITRVAVVKTKSGIFKRPVVKLCKLPTQ
uniref:Integrase catalytic domain-containing protein n=1 Tax=Cacopsylla melanoneura TaxID=428564 RepID=A0A8D9BE06_9HEMI